MSADNVSTRRADERKRVACRGWTGNILIEFARPVAEDVVIRMPIWDGGVLAFCARRRARK